MVVATICGMLLGTALAQEVDVERAKTLYSNGKMLFEEEEYGKAIEAWTLAWELSGKKQAILLYNIALAYEKMDNYTEAIDYLYQYRMYAAAEEQDGLKEKITELKQRQAEQAQQMQAMEESASEEVEVEPPQPEVVAVEPEPAAVPENPPAQGNMMSVFPVIATWSGTTALAVTSGVLWVSHQGARETLTEDFGCVYDDSVRRSEQKYLCSIEPTQDEIDKERNLTHANNIGWALTLASAGAASWLTYKYVTEKKSLVSTVHISPTGVAVGGRF